MAANDRPRILSNRIKHLWGSRLILWQENRHIVKSVTAIFAPVPFTGFVRRQHSPYGWSKRFNYITKTRRTWYRVYSFFRVH